MLRFITAIPNAMIVIKETQRPSPRVSPMDSRDIPELKARLLMAVFLFLFLLLHCDSIRRTKSSHHSCHGRYVLFFSKS